MTAPRTRGRYHDLDRETLAALVPELLLCGQLIDRSGMAWCIAALGREGMTAVAGEEWAAASPIYTRRMQRALRFEGDGVVTVFKGLQFDIGAPPQFMDFRFTVHDRRHGEFHLDHCGALMDVEPMGEAYVRAMCHQIEDATFDPTAAATHPRAAIRPVHRPPRAPADRHPHCAWTLTIDDANPLTTLTEGCREVQRSRAAGLGLDPIDPDDAGLADYAGPLLADVDFGAFSRSALARVADEVVLQMHLLNLGFLRALRQRLPEEAVQQIAVRQLTGIAGITAERLHRALRLPADPAAALRVLQLHPMLNPAAYVRTVLQTGADGGRDGGRLIVQPSPGHRDGGWPAACGPHSPRPVEAVLRAVDPRFTPVLEGTPTRWSVRVVEAAPARELEEVAVTRISTGSRFAFAPRRSLPVEVRSSRPGGTS